VHLLLHTQACMAYGQDSGMPVMGTKIQAILWVLIMITSCSPSTANNVSTTQEENFDDKSHGEIMQMKVCKGDSLWQAGIIVSIQVLYSDGKTVSHHHGKYLSPECLEWTPKGHIISGEIFFHRKVITGLRLRDNSGGKDFSIRGDEGLSNSYVLQPGIYKYFRGSVDFDLGITFLQMPYAPPEGPCTAKAVTGKWKYKFTVVAPTTQKWSHGTEKTDTRTKTEEWEESVTATVSQGWSLFGNDGSVEISGTIAHSTSEGYSSEWSTSESEEFQVEFKEDAVGKVTWQFVFSPADSCGNRLNSVTKEYALTEGMWRPPCCVPGWSVDAPVYKTCHSREAMVKNGEALGCIIDSQQALLV